MLKKVVGYVGLLPNCFILHSFKDQPAAPSVLKCRVPQIRHTKLKSHGI